MPEPNEPMGHSTPQPPPALPQPNGAPLPPTTDDADDAPPPLLLVTSPPTSPRGQHPTQSDANFAQIDAMLASSGAASSDKRHAYNLRLYGELLVSMGGPTKVSDIDRSPGRDQKTCPIKIGCALVLQRCGPRAEGYENLEAKATGNSVRSAVIQYWRLKGELGKYVLHASGNYGGNPGHSPAISKMIDTLTDQQKASGSHRTRRAYQMTHEDILALDAMYFTPYIMLAIKRDPEVDLLQLGVVVANALSFFSVSRADEVLRLRIEDLHFMGAGVDSNIYGVLDRNKTSKKKAKSKKTKTTAQTVYFRFMRGPHPGLDAIRKLLLWLAVLRAHSISVGYLFPSVKNNCFQPEVALRPDKYVSLLRVMGPETGIQGHLCAHSPRRGGAGYNYFVLRRDLFYICRAFGWDDIGECLRYIGIEDSPCSYALLGFTAFGNAELQWKV